MKKLSKQEGERAATYINLKQQAFLQSKARRKAFIGGRGSGKSSALGFEERLCFNYLPRAKRFMAGCTYNQILTKTLPSAMETWHTMGIREYDRETKRGHFVIGQRPPAHFYKPFQAPRNYENCITFINGYTIEMLSMDRPDLARGGNYDGGSVDESALMKEDVVNKILLPMIRANKYRFDNTYHHRFSHFSSAAWLPSGQWIYKYEEMKAADPDNYDYIESTAYDNKHVLPASYFEDLKKELSVLEFDVEVLNKRLNKLPNSFYPSFDEKKHCRLIGNWNYDFDDRTSLWLASQKDIASSQALDISFDFNAAICSAVIGQEHGREYRLLDTMYVKESRTNLVDELIDKILDKYATHGAQTINIYGDRNGNSRSAGNNKTFFEQIIDKILAKGWKYNLHVITEYPEHRLKFRVINGILAEDNPRLPVIRINQENCKYLIVSIQNSPINPDWTKDKRDESRLVAQERATHISDAFDYLIYRKYAHLFGHALYQAYQVRFLG